MATNTMLAFIALLFQVFVVAVNCSETVNNTSILETMEQLEKRINSRLEVCEKETNHLRASLAASIKRQEETMSNFQHSLAKRQLSPSQTVAFTVYVDHNVAHMGIDQVIPFNSVVTNIGGGFNVHTSTFTCPVSGLYFFAFVVSEIGNTELVAKLVVDGKNVVDAIANPIQVGHDQQGGNMAVIQVNKGQSVHVMNYFQNDVFLRTDENYRFASFSGILLQAADPLEVVG